MEEHPVPQNVTAFEFHLVGDMTIKQFGYLGGGAALAYVTYLLLFRPLPFLAVPMIVVLVLSGVAFAFLPIYERPLDHWVKAYFNAIFSATQRKFKSKVINTGTTGFDNRLQMYLQVIDPSSLATTAPNLGAISQLAPAPMPIVAVPAAIPQQPQIVPPQPKPAPQMVKTQPIAPVQAPPPPPPPIQPMPKPVVTQPVAPPKLNPNLPPVPRPAMTPPPVMARPQMPPPPPVAAKPAPSIGNARTEYAPVNNQAPVNTTTAHFMTPVMSTQPIPPLPPKPAPQPQKPPLMPVAPSAPVMAAPSQPAAQTTKITPPNIPVPPVVSIATPPPVVPAQPVHANQPIIQPVTLGSVAQNQIANQTVIPSNDLEFESKDIQATPSLQFANTGDANLGQIVKFAKEAQVIHSEILEVEKEMQDIKNQALVNPSVDKNKIAREYQSAAEKLQKLTNEETTVSRELASLSKAPPAAAQPNVKVVKAETEPTERFVVLTTTPNIINGIVTDTMGNYLEGVIVVTHDKDGLPVRALKTNKLGQFLAATPLGNGIYTLSLEKDSLNFDVLQIDLDGSVLPPIKISAKKGAPVA